jgi:hypothetical protein
VDITDWHRETIKRLSTHDREWVAEKLGEGFPPERVSAASIAALDPRLLAELEARIGANAVHGAL